MDCGSSAEKWLKLPSTTSLAGIRGIVGRDLTPQILLRLACAWGALLKSKKVVVATDSRPSGEMCKGIVVSGLVSTGCSVTDIGICPTPTAQIAVERLKAGGGVIITASHNPRGWNGLKFLDEEGQFIGPSTARRLLKIYYSGKTRCTGEDLIGSVETYPSAADIHIGLILRILNKNIIKKRRFKVVLDANNGAGSSIGPALLERLGCCIIRLNCKPDGFFAHPPEPTPSNLGELSRIVKKNKADAGFAMDADADRLAIVSEKGNCFSEEYTLVLSAAHILSKKKSVVVTNLSTTSAIDEVAGHYNLPVLRTKVGEASVVGLMRRKGAVVGGEGNGGLIYGPLHYGRDSLMAMGFILEYMAQSRKTLTELAEELPNYYLVKKKTRCRNSKFVLESLKKMFKDERTDIRDGIKVMWKDEWIHIRASQTEPVVRIFAEAKTEKRAQRLSSQMIRQVRKLDRGKS